MNKSFFGFSKYGIGTLLLAFLLAAILGVGIGHIAQPSPSQKVIKKAVESSPPSLQENFEFVSPQAVLLNTKAINKLEIVGLDSLVLTKISVALQTKKARAVSVYFQDLSNGKSWTINPNEKYTPASLMKVSVLLAILKTSESRPEMLHQELFFAQKQQANYTSEGSQGMELESQLIPERKYQVQHLIEEMIINSDNEATFLLLDFLEKTNKNELLEVERLFDILPPDNNIKAEDFITVSAYSRLFRTLYNASFLSVENSDYALELLSKAIFKSGIIQSIPPEVTVAHKYGLMAVRNQGFQLHHYGIVFHPVKPYLLGVMSKGDGGKDLRELLGSISGIVYNHVDEFSKKTEDLLYFDII